MKIALIALFIFVIGCKAADEQMYAPQCKEGYREMINTYLADSKYVFLSVDGTVPADVQEVREQLKNITFHLVQGEFETDPVYLNTDSLPKGEWGLDMVGGNGNCWKGFNFPVYIPELGWKGRYFLDYKNEYNISKERGEIDFTVVYMINPYKEYRLKLKRVN